MCPSVSDNVFTPYARLRHHHLNPSVHKDLSCGLQCRCCYSNNFLYICYSVVVKEWRGHWGVIMMPGYPLIITTNPHCLSPHLISISFNQLINAGILSTGVFRTQPRGHYLENPYLITLIFWIVPLASWGWIQNTLGTLACLTIFFFLASLTLYGIEGFSPLILLHKHYTYTHINHWVRPCLCTGASLWGEVCRSDFW